MNSRSGRTAARDDDGQRPAGVGTKRSGSGWGGCSDRMPLPQLHQGIVIPLQETATDDPGVTGCHGALTVSSSITHEVDPVALQRRASAPIG